MPNGVYRSLIIRGLLTSSRQLTLDGYEALASCSLLSEKFRETLLAVPIVRTSRRPTRTATEKSPGQRDQMSNSGLWRIKSGARCDAGFRARLSRLRVMS